VTICLFVQSTNRPQFLKEVYRSKGGTLYNIKSAKKCTPTHTHIQTHFYTHTHQ